MKAKKTFVLLELLIALALVSLALLPLLRYPGTCLKAELNDLFEKELQIELDSHLTRVKTQILQNEIEEKVLFAPKSEKEYDRLHEIELTLSKKFKRTFNRRTRIYRYLHKETEDKTLYSARVKIEVAFYPKGKTRGALVKGDTDLIAQKKQ